MDDAPGSHLNCGKAPHMHLYRCTTCVAFPLAPTSRSVPTLPTIHLLAPTSAPPACLHSYPHPHPHPAPMHMSAPTPTLCTHSRLNSCSPCCPRSRLGLCLCLHSHPCHRPCHLACPRHSAHPRQPACPCHLACKLPC
jgi:hypothetical protein